MNLSAIQADIDFLAGSDNTSYPTGDKNRNINIAYQNVARLIWESENSWQYDDSNATDYGIATTNLSSGTADYELPATAQRLHRVEVMDSAGNYIKLKPIDWHDMPVATTETFPSGGTPVYYDLVGRSIFLYPTPTTGYVTLTNGLKIYVDRVVTDLSTGSDVPGFALPFHRILSYAGAIDYVQDQKQRTNLLTDKILLEKALTRFYAKRSVEGRTAIKGKKRWRLYI